MGFAAAKYGEMGRWSNQRSLTERGNMTVQVTITGNATADAEMRFTPRGASVASFTVAVNERVKNEDGTWGDGDPTFYRVSAWDSIAENVAAEVKKGSRVLVTGTLKPRTYDGKDGNERVSLDVRADEVGISTGFRKTRVTSTMTGDVDGDTPF
jgi:single-strand DNA-binding protein